MNLKTRYVVKGIGKEQTISSVVNIFTDKDGKISKVEDKWDGKLPESSIANVSFLQLFSPFWWAFYVYAWCFYLWSFVWWTRPWLVRMSTVFSRLLLLSVETFDADDDLQAFRHLNSVTVPKMISVPKDKEEDAKRGNP